MGIMYEVPTKMASSWVESVESLSEIHQLFRDISLKFSPAESENVVQSVKRIYGEQFKSLGKQDLMSCLGRLYEFGYVTDTKLTLIKEFIATKSSNENDINQRIEDFETFRPPRSELEKILGERSDEITKIMEILENRQKPIVNLYGFAGLGKSTVAKAICGKWRGQTYVVDLKEAENMRAVCLNIMTTLGLPVLFDTERNITDSPELTISAGIYHEEDVLNVRQPKDTRTVRLDDIMDSLDLTTRDGSRARNYLVKRIFGHIVKESKDHPVLLVLDNLNLHVNLTSQLIDFLGKLSRYDSEPVTVHVLLTSRTQLRDSEVTDYEVQFLKNSVLEKISSSDAGEQQKKKVLDICKGVPLLLQGTAAILKQKRKSLGDLIDVIENTLCSSQVDEPELPVKSKGEEDMEERPFNSEEKGIDKEQATLIREMFYTLPSDTLRVSAVSLSLFHGPFTASTAANVLGVSTSEAVAQLEGLVTNEIIHVTDEDVEPLMYDIHPLLREYAESQKNDAMFYESYTEAKGGFYEHFMSKMKQIAGLIETSYIRAFNEFKTDRLNFEFAIDISLLPEYFSVPGGYHENAMIVSLFNAVLSEEKQTDVFHSWAEMCKDDGKFGSLFCAQLQCWEARLVSRGKGTKCMLRAFKVLKRASMSLKQVDDKSTESFKLTQGLYLYFEGEIYYQYRGYRTAIICLESSLDLMEGALKPDTNLVRCYNVLGNCYYGLDRPEKALEFYNKALKMREELSGSDYHFDMAVYKNQIATVYEKKGEYDEAVKCYKDALELLEELNCLGYEDEALFRRNLANVYVRQEKYKEAEEEAEKAFKIRLKILGNHPDTVRSNFQLGVIQVNLKAYHKALDFFLKAWEMEKLLGAGNQSVVWRHIIKGIFDMYELLKRKGTEKEKEEFRQDALVFCEHFWREKKIAFPPLQCTPCSKEIIDAIFYLLEIMTDKKEKDLIDKYKREAFWCYDKMQQITEPLFNFEFDSATDNKVLNELLRERTAFLDKLIELCSQQNKHEQLRNHKQRKMNLFKKVLVRSDFVGEKTQENSTLKKAVEELYKDLGREKSIDKFQENFLTPWQRQWEKEKGKEESREKLLASWQKMNRLLWHYETLARGNEKEALSFGNRLLDLRRSEMKSVEIKGLLNEMKEVALSIGDRERTDAYCSALQDLRVNIQPWTTRKLREKKHLFKPPISVHLVVGEEKDATEIGAEANVEVVSAQGTEFGLQGVTTEESEVAGVADEEGKGAESHGGSDEQVDVESAKNETEIKSEDDAEGEKEDLEVHEQVTELAGEEATEAESHGGSEEESEEESDDETETQGVDREGQNDNDEESRRIVTSEGTNWAIKQLGVHLMFSPNAVSEPTPIMVQRWKNSVCSPPLQEHEAITSNVIELSSMDSQDVKFNTKVKLSLSHSATNLRGYELVIKKLTDKETNKWEDLDGTKDIRSLEEIEDDFSSHVEIPDLFFPVAQGDISECSTYAVVCRLKVSPTYTITSKGGSFSHPDYPDVTVTIPENAVAPSAEFPLELKVQEVPNDELQEGVVFLGPILRINCFETVQFSRSVTIQLPISLREQQVLLPDPTTYRVRVLFLKSDDQEKEWIEITDDLGKPARFDGKFVRFQVERFSGYWPFLDRRTDTSSGDELRIKRFLYSLIWNQPRPAHFVAYFQPGSFFSILNLICCPAHLKKQVIQDLKQEGITPCHGSSKKDMIPENDKAFVFVSGGICPIEEKEMEDFYLKLYEDNLPFEAHLKVRLINDQHTAQVEFRNTFQPTGRNLSLCTLHLPIPNQYTYSMDFEELSRQPSVFSRDVKKGIPKNDELELLSEKIPDHWKKIGRRLGFDEAALRAFHKDNEKVAEKAYAMLIAWKQREGSAATYRVLNKGLILAQRRDLANKFCCY